MRNNGRSKLHQTCKYFSKGTVTPPSEQNSSSSQGHGVIRYHRCTVIDKDYGNNSGSAGVITVNNYKLFRTLFWYEKGWGTEWSYKCILNCLTKHRILGWSGLRPHWLEFISSFCCVKNIISALLIGSKWVFVLWITEKGACSNTKSIRPKNISLHHSSMVSVYA